MGKKLLTNHMVSRNNKNRVNNIQFFITGDWLKVGLEIDHLDNNTGKWWQGVVKEITDDPQDPEVLINYHRCLPESTPMSQCKLVFAITPSFPFTNHNTVFYKDLIHVFSNNVIY